MVAVDITCDRLIGSEGVAADHDSVRRGAQLRRDTVSRGHVRTPVDRSTARISGYSGQNSEPNSNKEQELHVSRERTHENRREDVTDLREKLLSPEMKGSF